MCWVLAWNLDLVASIPSALEKRIVFLEAPWFASVGLQNVPPSCGKRSEGVSVGFSSARKEI